MAKKRNLFQQNIVNERTRLRKRMEALARSHRGCATARGCGCFTDRALKLLEKVEADLFSLELESYSANEMHGGYDHYEKLHSAAGVTQRAEGTES